MHGFVFLFFFVSNKLSLIFELLLAAFFCKYGCLYVYISASEFMSFFSTVISVKFYFY